MKTAEELQAELTTAMAQIETLKGTADKSAQQEQRLLELQNKITEMGQSNADMARIINQFKASPPKPAAGDEMPDPVEKPEEYAAWLENKIRRGIQDQQRNTEDAVKAAEAVQARFYTAHPDLVAYKPIVAWFSNQVLSENPQVGEGDGFKLVAERARAWIKENVTVNPKSAPPAPHVGGGAPPPPPPAPQPEQPVYDAAANTADTVAEMKGRTHRAIVSGTGPAPAQK